ncbi:MULTISPECIES: TadE/TadG family type IV pilus assembly protein [Paraburkholderia]|jgi:Flp pilus assembly protein TadG|uniref:Pilus assembly protein n=1 Tax=Paraburkholderia madseniana TaxID=2599607 RepID=A0A6N6VZN5_9BURK|nr:MULTISPECIES: TadE/TadG family type IV pilus assembly protein [Paraburkholderia]KAE8753429.1 pilus assembly protein [Paraburkholderia madseniana]MCX4172255.1 pilus assembly protein [Paraburkholderia madseniana]MDQ6460264.1 pilus assembly protein [Paraburkholderia madseniana]NPT66426.1 pilus assembly protein [Paraburkholderia madseniana]
MKRVTTQPAHSPLKHIHTRCARAQRGSTAIEFALVFPLFFTILYSIITFSLIFVAQQNLTLAAEEGARAALNWQSNTSLQNALVNRGNAACAAANLMVATLVQSMQCTSTSAPCGPGNTMQCVNVLLTYNYQANPLVPTLPLLSYTLPNTLSSSATVQLNPENIQ